MVRGLLERRSFFKGRDQGEVDVFAVRARHHRRCQRTEFDRVTFDLVAARKRIAAAGSRDPSVLRAQNDVRFALIPARHHRLVAETNDSAVLVASVEDLDGLYRKSRVVCAPILWGGGTRFKIIEAASYCKPIVSTLIGAE